MSEDSQRQVDAMTSEERRRFDEKAWQSVVRFDELAVDWRSYPDTMLSDFQRGLRLLVADEPEGAEPDRSRSRARQFTVAIIEAEPGRGAALHAHTTEEVFLPLRGQWTVYWSPDEDDIPLRETTLGEWDSITLPGPVMRGFRNVSDETGFLLIITGAPTPVIHHPSIISRVARRGTGSE